MGISDIISYNICYRFRVLHCWHWLWVTPVPTNGRTDSRQGGFAPKHQGYSLLPDHSAGDLDVISVGTRHPCLHMQAHSHTHTHGGAAQLEVGSLPVSVSWPSALHCYLCRTHCSPSNVPNPPTPGPLMSTPLVNTGQPTLYKASNGSIWCVQ